MRSVTLRVFGVPVLSLEIGNVEFFDEEVEYPAVGGGSAHDFTLAEAFVDERYLPWEDEAKSFGFGGAL